MFRLPGGRQTRAWVLAVLLSSVWVSSMQATEFVASFRDSTGLFLVTRGGEIFRVTTTAAPHRVLVLSQSPGRPYRWARTIRSLVRWRSEWLVADGTSTIARFGRDGFLTGVTNVPFRIASLVIAADRIWGLNMLAMTSDEQLWHSRDGTAFLPLKASKRDRFESPLANLLILGGGSAGELYVTPVIGPPVVRQVWPVQRARRIELAYSRTKHRTTLEDIVGLLDDISPYSQPARDLLVGEGGELYVLRNREDVINPDGKKETIVGRRVDRYTVAGHHVATAVLPATGRWIAEVTPAEVTILSSSGAMLTAKWRKPVPSEVFP